MTVVAELYLKINAIFPLNFYKTKSPFWNKTGPNGWGEWWSKSDLPWWYTSRDEMDNEVSICCFYAVIRNCHTPFHFFISLGLFACWSFLWSRKESIKLAPSRKAERWLMGVLPIPRHWGPVPEAGMSRHIVHWSSEESSEQQLPWQRITWRSFLPGREGWPSPRIRL